MAQDSTNIKETIGALDDYVLLGRSGLRISPLCLGTLTFGEASGLFSKVGSNNEESKKVFDYYYEKGGNFFDTANVYNFGASERFLGEYIADKRSQVVIATKYTMNTTGKLQDIKFNPNAGGNHRKSLVENLNESLKRLGTRHIDLMYVHAWEYRTPIEEVLRSLDDVVRSGKVLYVAISDSPAWVISCANAIAELRGWSPFIGLQTRYNLLNRSLEYDLLSACTELDVGIIPWGCVAEGFLTGKYTRGSIASIKKSGDIRQMRDLSLIGLAEREQSWQILDEVKAIAAETKRSPVQVALNWILQKPGITSPLVGARTKAQLVENLKALEFKLTPEQMTRLDDVSETDIQPFPYSFIKSNFEAYIGKGIQVPDKYKRVLKLDVQGKL